jgi:hypothetical protein
MGSHGRMTKGCLIGTIAQELALTNAEIGEACRDMFSRIATAFEKDLLEAKGKYGARADFDARKLANLYVTIVQGSLVLAKSARNNEVLVDNLEQFRQHIQLLLGHSGEATKAARKESTRAIRNN